MTPTGSWPLVGERRQAAEDAFTAGMLHDVGQLILATRLPADFERGHRSLRDDPRPR